MTTKTKTLMSINKKTQKLDSYAGKWVAFIETRVVSSNDTLGGLMKEVKQKGLADKVSVFLVPRKNEGPYVLIIL